MRVLAGGPARETESALFQLHREGLEAQEGFDLTIRHEVVEDPGGPRWTGGKIEAVAKTRQRFMEDANKGTHEFVRDNGDGTIEARARTPEELLSDPDALFMVDTDVILGPGVLERMWQVDAPVVYGVFWTKADWGKGSDVWPQCWDVHPFRFTEECWKGLNADGVNEVEVYGGGACTLIRGRGFESRYWPLLESLKHAGGIWSGEDRTFALGCETRGIKQVAVTGLPIVHCYNLQDRTKPALERARQEVGLEPARP